MEQDYSGMKVKTCIIDPVSSQFNRGGFCYFPFVLEAAIEDSFLIEEFGAAELDKLPQAEEYLIALWSYPQIEHVAAMLQFLPKGKARVFGYNPLITAMGFPLFRPSDDLLKAGFGAFVKRQHKYKTILYSDSDMHLSNLVKEGNRLWPFFTSHGCPKGCAFCPATVNQHKRIVLDLETVRENLIWMGEHGEPNLHFGDEDFFFDIERAKAICDILLELNYDWNLVVLAERMTLLAFIRKYGSEILKQAGFKLLEVGLETADPMLSKQMGKPGPNRAARLYEVCEVPILWLCITFFPGETIQTLRASGDFLRQYGLDPDALTPRIAGNGTYGGLGQFFQPYHGTKGFEDLPTQGISLTPRPTRLLPSYLPYSFLDQKITTWNGVREEDWRWYELYQVRLPSEAVVGHQIQTAATKFYSTLAEGCMSLAIAAKTGAIE